MIASEQRTASGLEVTLKGTGKLARGSHPVTIARQVSCTHSEVFAKLTLRGGTLSVTLPPPGEAGAVSYYRAQTPVGGKQSYSLPIAVKAAS